MDNQVVISAVGMVTPIGVNEVQTFASVRADMTRMREAGDIYWCMADDPDFEDGTPLIASTLSYLESVSTERDRPVEWLAHVAAQAFFTLRNKVRLSLSDYRHVGLFMALPPKRPGWGHDLEEEFVYHFHNAIELDIFPLEEFAYSGHAGALALIESACARLASGQIKYGLLGGVDSYLFPEWLALLDKAYRIKSDRNMDGFLPGEGAAFLFLEPAGQPEKRDISALANIKYAIEAKCPQQELAHNTGTVLSRMLNEMLEVVSPAPVIICDLNGEPVRMKEWGYAYTRLGERLGVPLALEHPADCLGDLGAASGAVLTGLAVFYLQMKYPQHTSALVWTASDTGERSAVLIEKVYN